MEQMANYADESQGSTEFRVGKYLTLQLAGEEYAISILKVKEIIGMMSITPVPQTPEYVKGVINLRGKVISVVDLRLRFTMEAEDYSDRTCIIVVEIATQSGTTPVGIVVDSVSEVLNIGPNDVQDAPALSTGIDTSYILGIANMEGSVKILLDIDRVLNRDELKMLEESSLQ
jgi:purine-binding chemotaxis protein CheW